MLYRGSYSLILERVAKEELELGLALPLCRWRRYLLAQREPFRSLAVAILYTVLKSLSKIKEDIWLTLCTEGFVTDSTLADPSR